MSCRKVTLPSAPNLYSSVPVAVLVPWSHAAFSKMDVGVESGSPAAWLTSLRVEASGQPELPVQTNLFKFVVKPSSINIRNFIGTTSLRTSRLLSATSMLPRGVGGLRASTTTYFVPSVSYAIRGHSVKRVVSLGTLFLALGCGTGTAQAQYTDGSTMVLGLKQEKRRDVSCAMVPRTPVFHAHEEGLWRRNCLFKRIGWSAAASRRRLNRDSSPQSEGSNHALRTHRP